MMKTAQWIQNPKVREPLLCIVSGILLALCFPPYNCETLVLFFLIPTLYTLKPTQFKRNYLKGFLTGVAFYLPLLYWVGHAIIPGMFALVLYVSVFFAIPFSIYFLIPQKWMRPIVFGVVWGLIEYIRTLGYFSFAWGFLAHGSERGLYYVQNPYLSIPIISGMIAAINAFIFEFNLYIQSKPKEWKDNLDKQVLLWGVLSIGLIIPIIIIMVICINVIWKKTDVENPANKSNSLTVALLQGDFGMEAEDYDDTRDEVDVYLDLAAQAMTQSPELIIFPESTISVSLNHSTRYIRQLSEFVDSNDVEMLVGAVHGLYDDGSWKFWNRAYLFSPGQVFDYSQDPVIMAGMQTYDKMHLVPYGEWIPFGDIPVFGWIETLIEEAGAGIFQRGTEQTIFELRNGAKFAVAICFESTLSSQLKNAKQKGADFLVNITNDAWFKRSPGLAQHFLQSQFRAAENNCYMLRCANTGITAVIKPNGQIQTRIPDNEVGYLVDTINY